MPNVIKLIMPQKKTTSKTTSSKKRKSPAKRRTSKKPKVYIPAYKAIILCCAIITVCMGLLLFTTLKNRDSKLADAVVERYQEEKSEPKAEDKKIEQSEAPKKSEAKKEPSTKIETPQVKEEKKSVPSSTKSTSSTETVKPSATQASSENQKNTSKVPPVKTEPEKKSGYNFPQAKNNAQLIFVFDDGGQNLSHLTPFLNLPFPITVAVLPQIAHSAESAERVRKSGNELILHQPMQSVNASVNPGPGAIKPAMNENDIKSILFKNITEIGPVAGMNNHEGSGITADADKMAVVLQFCSQEGIYFLDSRTNVETKVPYVARELGYTYYERNIFLDNEKTVANALKELKKGLDLANKNGNVIMIGHIWSADFLPAFLQDIYPELKAKGYTFSTVSKSKAKKN